MNQEPTIKLKIVIEDDPVLRIFKLVWSSRPALESTDPFVDYFMHDVADPQAALRAVADELGILDAEAVFVRDAVELEAESQDADVVIVESLILGSDAVARARKLKLVQKFGTLTENIDLAALEAHGIVVQTLRRRANSSVAEHTLTLMLALLRKLHQSDGLVSVERVAASGVQARMKPPAGTAPFSNWARVRDVRSLRGSTVGLIGCGEIGLEVARMLAALGANIIYTKRTRLREDIESSLSMRYTGLPELLGEADIVSLHIPYQSGTASMIDAEALALMKPTAFLINTSRAGLVDREALHHALKQRIIAGAGLDVFHEEPLPEHDPLLTTSNTILTPHLAGGSRWNNVYDLNEIMAAIATVVDGRSTESGDADARATPASQLGS